MSHSSPGVLNLLHLLPLLPLHLLRQPTPSSPTHWLKMTTSLGTPAAPWLMHNSKLVASGMTCESQMPNALEDLVRKHGAPNCLFSDNAKVGKCVCDILHLCCIKGFQCELECQHQSFAERKIGDVKRACSGIMDRMGAPAAFWLLCLFHVIFLLDHMASNGCSRRHDTHLRSFGRKRQHFPSPQLPLVGTNPASKQRRFPF
jgi:hypothetical protein